ncbi:hypothetical protein AA106555_0272 [Neokomagataea thailandica NBRC 106555]|uniref:Uncharacterized protein n=1 Tax=Neokomagataea thailandica NBRC 106555 TaxID=1223520 RepID=A0ABQ0QMQ9_9PROT|nr:hypothetical protein AA106555_0272 [Neokomagataea thailandica NBRC 106555]
MRGKAGPCEADKHSTLFYPIQNMFARGIAAKGAVRRNKNGNLCAAQSCAGDVMVFRDCIEGLIQEKIRAC